MARKSSFSYAVNYTQQIARNERRLELAERALAESWCLDDLFPGEDLSSFKNGISFYDLLSEEDDELTERVKTILAFTDDDLAALRTFEGSDRQLCGRAPERHVWKRWNAEKQAAYTRGQTVYTSLVTFHVLVRERMVAERKRLKATIARHKRNRTKYGDA